MRIEVVTPPEPGSVVTLAEARAYLRIATDEDDALLGVLVEAARRQVEFVTGYAVGFQTRRLTVDAWPAGRNSVPLPSPPLVSIVSVDRAGADGEPVDVEADHYFVDTRGAPGAVYRRADFPASTGGRLGITYTCGFGAEDGEAVPDTLRLAVLQLAAHWYEQRTPVVVGTITAEVPNTFQFLTAAHHFRYRFPT